MSSGAIPTASPSTCRRLRAGRRVAPLRTRSSIGSRPRSHIPSGPPSTLRTASSWCCCRAIPSTYTRRSSARLKAGAAFTCIDPVFPDGQVRTIIDDADPVAVVTDAAGRERLAQLGVRVRVVDVREAAAQAVPIARPAWLTPASLAYLIYTSGTTGQPKGVMIEHRSIVSLVLGDVATLGVTPADRVAQNSSSAYDSSIEETWFALAVGATLVVMDDETVRLGPDLPAWLRRERVTMFCPPPTMLRATGCADPARELPELRLLHPGGEALSQDIADRWSAGRRVVNDYGPTETTITALRAVIEPGRPVAIGTPVPGVHAWVLDENLQPVPDGRPGELCIGGAGLARGYRNDAALTARKFPVHPQLGRLYRTGDLATRGADGRFYSHGRIDAQVKIRGYRIELEAVEARLAEMPGVREAACTVQGEGVRKTLVGFVVPERPGAIVDPAPLKSRLSELLPAYMVPAQIGTLESLPRNSSNKLNRRALPPLAIDAHGERSPAAAPRDEREARVVAAMQQALGLPHAVGVDEDFFDDLGGDSFASAVLVSRLRDHADTALLTVRDVYEARTASALAARVAANDHVARGAGAHVARNAAPRAMGRPVLATLAQAAGLLLGILVLAPIAYVLSFDAFPAVVDAVGPEVVVVLAPLVYVAGVVVYGLVTALLAVAAKRLLIGTYRPTSAPVWGGFYLRNWVVQRLVRLVPWGLLEATVFQHVLLRALGARIGARVHLHRGVTLLEGGWDLLEIGDDAAVGQDAALGLVAFVDGQIEIRPVKLGARATVEARAAVEGGASLGDGAELSAWSYLAAGSRIPDGERWDGVPAEPAGQTPPPPDVDRSRDLSPAAHGLALIGGRLLLALFLALPIQILVVATAVALKVDAATFLEWLFHPLTEARYWLLEAVPIVLAVPATLAFEALALRSAGPPRTRRREPLWPGIPATAFEDRDAGIRRPLAVRHAALARVVACRRHARRKGQRDRHDHRHRAGARRNRQRKLLRRRRLSRGAPDRAGHGHARARAWWATVRSSATSLSSAAARPWPMACCSACAPSRTSAPRCAARRGSGIRRFSCTLAKPTGVDRAVSRTSRACCVI